MGVIRLPWKGFSYGIIYGSTDSQSVPPVWNKILFLEQRSKNFWNKKYKGEQILYYYTGFGTELEQELCLVQPINFFFNYNALYKQLSS